MSSFQEEDQRSQEGEMLQHQAGHQGPWVPGLALLLPRCDDENNYI